MRKTRSKSQTAVVIVSKWTGRVAFVTGTAVAVGWGISLVATTLNGGHVEPELSSILSTIGGVLAGGVAAYIGRGMTEPPVNPPQGGTVTTTISASEPDTP